MLSRFSLSIIVLIISLIFGLLLFIDGVAVKISWLRFLTPIITVLALLLSIFDLFLWKVLPESLIKRPKIYGTWRGTIQSNWRNPNTGNQIDPIECYTVIRQTFSKISYRQMTAESSSKVIDGGIISHSDGVFQIGGIYRNEPQFPFRDQSPIHYGGQLLTVIGKPATSLKGEYWTTRNTAGQLDLTKRKKKIFHDFQSAKAAFDSKNLIVKDRKKS